MKSILGIAQTPYGICGFEYVDDNDLKKLIQEKQTTDSEGLKNCNIDESVPLPDIKLTRQQFLEKVQNELRSNRQLKIFLSRLPVEQQKKIIQDMISSIMGLYEEQK